MFSVSSGMRGVFDRCDITSEEALVSTHSVQVLLVVVVAHLLADFIAKPLFSRAARRLAIPVGRSAGRRLMPGYS